MHEEGCAPKRPISSVSVSSNVWRHEKYHEFAMFSVKDALPSRCGCALAPVAGRRTAAPVAGRRIMFAPGAAANKSWCDRG